MKPRKKIRYMDTSVSNESSLCDFTVGPITVDNIKDNGERILNCSLADNLAIANTWFQRPNIAKHIWCSNDVSTKKILDYIIIHRRWLLSVQNFGTYHGAKLGNTSHRLVAKKIRLRLKATKPSQAAWEIDTYHI
ncbi:hypothetical protein QYM36_007073 [Artemia franciscana]|uniref:Uncharacterized protein n=1 Tax=Artemia franciscana TaxID=6661 RepID=A0AA88L8L4_ARTSF|nr:hypothetical protein QYM36_007073 [Artemia franciscana]